MSNSSEIYDLYLSIVTHPFTWIAIGLTLVFFAVQSLTRTHDDERRDPADWLRGLGKGLGMDGVSPALVLIALVTWSVLAVTLLFGVYKILWDVIFYPPPDPQRADWNWRFTLAQLAALTTVLGAVIALPVTMNRLILTRRQTDTAEQGHITDRINKAVEMLGAEKTVSRIGRPVTVWTGAPRTMTHLLDDPESFELPPRSVEVSRYEDVTNLEPDGNGIFEGVHIEVTSWPSEATIVQWQNVGVDIRDTDHVVSVGDWQVFEESQPNLEVRVGAIYALERIAQDSDRDHVQIMEILCAYIRQNAPAEDAVEWPELEMKDGEEDGPLEADWDERLKTFRDKQAEVKETLTCRTDIQTALTVIGRRDAEQRRIEAGPGKGEKGVFPFDTPCPEPDLPEEDHDPERLAAYQAELHNWRDALHNYPGYRLDLRNTNLQGADLSGLELNGAQLNDARLQGASLRKARLQGAGLLAAQLQGAGLWEAQLQGAGLWKAQLQGAGLWEARFDQSTSLSAANFAGSALRDVDFTDIPQIADHVADAFGDGSVTLPDEVEWPKHWPVHELDGSDFYEEWRKWQADPENYTPPTE